MKNLIHKMDKLQTAFDNNGLNVLDPHDSLGIKSEYISLIHEIAIRRYLPKGNGQQIALDLGCGYGRISPFLKYQGWRVIGVDPDISLLKHAKAHNLGIEFCQGGLPYLPFNKMSIDLILLHNLLRPLLQMDKVNYIDELADYLSSDGMLVVVDNIRSGHPEYFDEPELVSLFTKQGLKLINRVPIRNGRWWLLYLIRYGLIPKQFLPYIANYELDKCRHVSKFSRWKYMNVMYQFSR